MEDEVATFTHTVVVCAVLPYLLSSSLKYESLCKLTKVDLLKIKFCLLMTCPEILVAAD